MPKEKQTQPTEEQTLAICNLVSRGETLENAKKKILESSKPEETNQDNNVVPFEKLSAKEKKEILSKEIEALGGKPPANNASVAVFQQTLEALQDQNEALQDQNEGGDQNEALQDQNEGGDQLM